MTAGLGDADRARMSRRGVLALSPDEGIAAFDAARRHGGAHVLAIKLDRSTIEDRPVLSELRSSMSSDVTPNLLQRWVDTVPGMRRSVITHFVDEQAKKVLGLPSSSVIAARQPFNEIGLDSLMAVELRNAIGAALGRPQPATLLFDHPTSASLVDFLVTLADGDGTAAPQRRPEAPAVAASIDAADLSADVHMLAELSEAEAEAFLLAELSSTDHDA
jgi:acyl carrier protein